MSFIERALTGKQIEDVWVDSEVTCLTLTDGTVITIRGLVLIEPRQLITPVAGSKLGTVPLAG